MDNRWDKQDPRVLRFLQEYIDSIQEIRQKYGYPEYRASDNPEVHRKFCKELEPYMNIWKERVKIMRRNDLKEKVCVTCGVPAEDLLGIVQGKGIPIHKYRKRFKKRKDE